MKLKNAYIKSNTLNKVKRNFGLKEHNILYKSKSYPFNSNFLFTLFGVLFY